MQNFTRYPEENVSRFLMILKLNLMGLLNLHIDIGTR